ncbi:MAG: hypothetical protein MUC91_02550 [Verrucomicrobia bacterium]|nr:hypothetical protein [Verrucomicrobiota bacterium]
MDLSLESALAAASGTANQPGSIAGRPMSEWNAAYTRAEGYFLALRVRNRMLTGRLVMDVLGRAVRRAPNEPDRSATELVAEEMDRTITEWFGQILEQPPTGADQMLSTRGRLALLLTDMPGRWQDQLLQPGPWPAEFVRAMRETYLRAGPDFQLARMEPRQLDLGAIATLTKISRLPYFKMVGVWIIFALLLALLFLITH